MILTPTKYKNWQIVLDQKFSIGVEKQRKGSRIVARIEEITDNSGLSRKFIEDAMLFLVHSGLVKHTGESGQHEYALTPKGQVASFKKSISRTGADNRFKNIQVYYTILLIIGTVFSSVTFFIDKPGEVLESTVQNLEEEVVILSKKLDSLDYSYSLVNDVEILSDSVSQ